MNDKLRLILTIAIIVALGMFIFMKFIDWKYKSELLMQPCTLCQKVNPKQAQCINDCFRQPIYSSDWDFTPNLTLPSPSG